MKTMFVLKVWLFSISCLVCEFYYHVPNRYLSALGPHLLLPEVARWLQMSALTSQVERTMSFTIHMLQ